MQFNTPILNNPNNPFGVDFIIFGHAGFIEGISARRNRRGRLVYTGGTSDVRVSVSADGMTFYTLNPALTPAGGRPVSQLTEAAIHFCR